MAGDSGSDHRAEVPRIFRDLHQIATPMPITCLTERLRHKRNHHEEPPQVCWSIGLQIGLGLELSNVKTPWCFDCWSRRLIDIENLDCRNSRLPEHYPKPQPESSPYGSGIHGHEYSSTNESSRGFYVPPSPDYESICPKEENVPYSTTWPLTH